MRGYIIFEIVLRNSRVPRMMGLDVRKKGSEFSRTQVKKNLTNTKIRGLCICTSMWFSLSKSLAGLGWRSYRVNWDTERRLLCPFQ